AEAGRPIRHHARKPRCVSLDEPGDSSFPLVRITTLFRLAGFAAHFHFAFSHCTQFMLTADTRGEGVPLRVHHRISDRLPYPGDGSMDGHLIVDLQCGHEPPPLTNR